MQRRIIMQREGEDKEVVASGRKFQFESFNMKEHRDGGEVKVAVYEAKHCSSAVEAGVFLPSLESQGDSD